VQFRHTRHNIYFWTRGSARACSFDRVLVFRPFSRRVCYSPLAFSKALSHANSRLNHRKIRMTLKQSSRSWKKHGIRPVWVKSRLPGSLLSAEMSSMSSPGPSRDPQYHEGIKKRQALTFKASRGDVESINARDPTEHPERGSGLDSRARERTTKEWNYQVKVSTIYRNSKLRFYAKLACYPKSELL
jgi:hypothetical protein